MSWTRRRWRFREPAGAWQMFTEALPAIPPRSRLTGRLRTSAVSAGADHGRRAAPFAGGFGHLLVIEGPEMSMSWAPRQPGPGSRSAFDRLPRKATFIPGTSRSPPRTGQRHRATDSGLLLA